MSIFVSKGKGSTTIGLSTRYVEGLICKYVSTTIIDVGVGSCRNKLNTNNMSLTAARTADVTTAHGSGDGLAQDDGLDEKGLDNLSTSPIMCSQTTTTITASADITGHLGTRTGSGTITTVGTAGSAGTGLMSQISVGDLVGNSSNGWSRVTAIASDSAFTLTAAIPGGDLTTAAFTIIENATIQPNNAAKDRIDTISAAGTAIVVATSASHSASSPLTIGVEVNDQWIAIYVVDTLAGDASKLLLSTQRTTPLTETGGTTKWPNFRRVGWTRNNASGDFFEFYQIDDGRTREIRYEIGVNSNGDRVLSSGSSTAWSPIDLSLIVPPTSKLAYIHFTMNLPASAAVVQVRARNTGSSTTSRSLSGGAEASGRGDAQGRAYLDGAQFLDYRVSADNDAFIDVIGYWDEL